jgi:hypothetical protein
MLAGPGVRSYRDVSSDSFSGFSALASSSTSWLDTHEFQNGMAIFRRSLMISFVVLFLLYESGFFSALHSALKPQSFNETTPTPSFSSSSSSSASISSATIDSPTSKMETKITYYGDATDPYPPEQNFLEVPRNRKGKCVAVVGLQGTGTIWLSLIAQEILTLRKQRFHPEDEAKVVWGLNRGWFSRKGEDYESTIKLLQNDYLVLVNLRYDDLILNQADVILEGYRDLRDYVAFQIPSKKTEKGAFESLSKGFFHLIEWHPHVNHRVRFEAIVTDKLAQVRDIAYAILEDDVSAESSGISLTDQDLKGIIDRVDEKMMNTREFSLVAIHPSVNSGVGSYKTQLSAEVIKSIEDQYRPWLRKFGYLN